MSRRSQPRLDATPPGPVSKRRWPRALAATTVAALATATLTSAAVDAPSAVQRPDPTDALVEATGLLRLIDTEEVTTSNTAGGARTDATEASSTGPDTLSAGAAVPSERYVMMKRIQVARQRAATRPSRSTTRSDGGSTSRRQRPRPPAWLRECTDRAADNARSHSNGQVPASELCPLPVSGHLLHPDAAYGWWQVNRAFTRRFGSGICVTDSYRSYEAQSAVYGAKPGLAAVPGTSNHGWGVAMDLCGGVESYASPQHVWLAEHGAKYGWLNPSWAQAGGSRPEPWHWEYEGR